jgi:predicted transcriptional regulator
MLLSIHPVYVEQILTGTKTVELRRTRPNVAPGQPVVIYATTPSAALVATCRIKRLEIGSPRAIWTSVGNLAAVTKDEFDRYFAGSSSAVALHISDVTELSSTVSLDQLRESCGFHPPQTWHFWTGDRLRRFSEHHHPLRALHPLLIG